MADTGPPEVDLEFVPTQDMFHEILKRYDNVIIMATSKMPDTREVALVTPMTTVTQISGNEYALMGMLDAQLARIRMKMATLLCGYDASQFEARGDSDTA